MGCRNEYMSGSEYVPLRKELDKVTRLLCEVLTIVEKEPVMLFIRGTVDELPEWWDKHKEADRKRQEEEDKKRRAEEEKVLRKQQRQAILARLTPEERAILQGK